MVSSPQQLRDRSGARVRQLLALGLRQARFQELRDAPGEERVLQLVGRDLRHDRADFGVVRGLRLVLGQDSAERLAHATFDCVLERDCKQASLG